MHTKAICKPTARCSQFYHPHCYATGSSSSNQCLDSMALMVVATRESEKYMTGPTTRRIHCQYLLEGLEALEQAT